jgi:hypothetical protein
MFDGIGNRGSRDSQAIQYSFQRVSIQTHIYVSRAKSRPGSSSVTERVNGFGSAASYSISSSRGYSSTSRSLIALLFRQPGFTRWADGFSYLAAVWGPHKSITSYAPQSIAIYPEHADPADAFESILGA